LEDKLYYSGYFFTGKRTNRNLYINDYKKLKETLIKKYGKPKTDIPGLWKNDLYKDDKIIGGMAISVGHLTYGASWETPNTKIDIMLSGDNYKINLVVFYASKELEEWVKQIKKGHFQ